MQSISESSLISPKKDHIVSNTFRPATPLNITPPTYPPEAQDAGLEGITKLRIQLSKTGKVQDVKIIETSGHSILDEWAKEKAYLWTFTPAFKGSVAIDSIVEIPVPFEL